VVIQRTEMFMRIISEIDRYLCELGNEGRLISMQIDEILSNIETDALFILGDYMNYPENKSIEELQKQIIYLNRDELIDLNTIYRILGYQSGANMIESYVSPKGYRLLNRIPRVPLAVIKNLIDRFKNIQGILNASIEELDDVDGIGEARAVAIRSGLKRLQEQAILDSRIH
jgi:diadenylate cyclase